MLLNDPYAGKDRLTRAVASAVAQLHRLVGRTLAPLSVSLEDMDEGRRDVVEGRRYAVEEVRRELRPPAKVR